MEKAHPQTMKERALAIARTRGVVRAKDFTAAGVARTYIQRLCKDGLLVRVGRGLYQAADAEIAAEHSLVEASLALPHGIVCLLSALQYHHLTTQTPHQVWMMTGSKNWAPTSPPVSLRIIRATGSALHEGVEHHDIEGIKVPIYSPAKTVADCFKHRNKVGLDVAIEALRDCLRHGKCSTDDLWRYAKICRVHNLMRPYIEALL